MLELTSGTKWGLRSHFGGLFAPSLAQGVFFLHNGYACYYELGISVYKHHRTNGIVKLIEITILSR